MALPAGFITHHGVLSAMGISLWIVVVAREKVENAYMYTYVPHSMFV